MDKYHPAAMMRKDISKLEQENAKLKAQLENTRLGLEKMEVLLMDTSSPVGDICFIQKDRDGISIFDGSTESSIYFAPTLADLITKIALMEAE